MVTPPIVVSTCDKYCWMVPLFLDNWHYVWRACPNTFIILGETKMPVSVRDRAQVVLTGKPQDWSRNMLYFLEGRKGPFHLLLEDYMLAAIDVELWRYAEHVMCNDPDVGMLRTYACPGPTKPHPMEHIGTFDRALREPSYLLSLQASLWRPQWLSSLLRPGESPWDVEIRGSVRAKVGSRWHLLGLERSALAYPELMKRGRVLPHVVEELHRKGFDVDDYRA